MTTGIRWLYVLLLQPRALTEDERRREFILNILLLGSIILLITANLAIAHRVIYTPGNYTLLTGIPVLIMLIFLGLLILSRKKHVAYASFGLLAFYFVSITYAMLVWGADLPQAALSYVLVIIISSILISTRFGFIATLVVAGSMLGIGYLQEQHYIQPDLSWRTQDLRVDDLLIFAATYMFVMLVSWLSNREIERSLHRARSSEGALKQERDLLEFKVEERTTELKQAQLERITELYRFAEFGRLASGLFHDLINPLTALVLSTHELDGKTPGVGDIQGRLERTLAATRKMEDFMAALRKELSAPVLHAQFSLNEEIHQVMELFNYKAQAAGVRMHFVRTMDIQTYGNPLKFHQVVANLISNAIDAYHADLSAGSPKREVIISLARHHTVARLVVKDFGIGIAPDVLPKIFEPFYTTKSLGRGTGLGLSTTKYLLEKDFSGHITVFSVLGQGSTFTVEFAV